LNYSIQLYQSLRDIAAHQWNLGNEILPLSMNKNYLQMIEEEHSKELEFHYVLILQQQQTVGILCFQIVNFKGAYIKNFFRNEVKKGVFQELFLKFFYKVVDFFNWNLLTAGNIFFTGASGIYFHSQVAPAERLNLIHQAFKKVEKQTKKKITAYMVNNIYDEERPVVHEYLNQYQYARYPVDPDMFMKIDPKWLKFEDYCDSLSSKYRVRMRKVLQQSSNIEKRLLQFHEIVANQAILYQLYLNTAQKVNLNLGYLSTQYFTKMATIWGDDFKVVGYYSENKLIGFMSLLTEEAVMDVNYMGLDYDFNFKYNLYNRMLLDLVALGIDLQVEIMHLGRTATEMKSTVGAEAKSMHIYLRATNSLFNKGMNFFQPYFGSPQYTLRSPFK
jgi:hypothetical protein